MGSLFSSTSYVNPYYLLRITMTYIVYKADSISADTSLFVVLSGFTVAVQLRDPPQKCYEGSRVKPRAPFDWRKYILGRAVGVLPIFWLSLIVAAPKWKENDNRVIMSGKYTREQSDECIALYIFAMESWVLPQCGVLGIDTSLYGSMIFNIFLIYCAFRYFLSILQNSILEWRSESLVQDEKSLWVRARNIVTMLAFNRPCLSVAIGAILFWLLVNSILLFVPVMVVVGWKNALSYFPFFLLGLSSANLVECIHWVMWNQHISLHSWTDSNLLPSPFTKNPSTIFYANQLKIILQ